MTSLASGLPFTATEFQIFVNSRYRPTRELELDFQDFRAGDERFDGGDHIGVAGGLAARQGTSITAQRRQMLQYGL